MQPDVLRTALTAAPRRLLDALLPPRCLDCGGLVDRQGSLCAECWSAIGFLAPPWCARCGLPFELPEPPGTVCEACRRQPPHFGRARAVLAYDDASRDLILRFKNADRTLAGPPFGRWMARAGADLWPTADLLVAVPLHRRRLIARRYNQSALLAAALSRETGIPALPDLLRRVRATPSQGGLSPGERRANVRGAFGVRRRYLARIAGLRLVLVDDVFTTGATVDALTQTLTKAGAAGVDVVTLARVARQRPLR
ncbi:MAG: ComF family protein [Rhodospirillaceae bacterium]|nr:ComF family protein [Rhodospirillaceae bacterium]